MTASTGDDVSEISGLQWVADGLGAIALLLGGATLKDVKDAQTRIEAKHDTLASSVPNTYARRDDLKTAVDDVKTSLRRIEDRLGTTPTH